MPFLLLVFSLLLLLLLLRKTFTGESIYKMFVVCLLAGFSSNFVSYWQYSKITLIHHWWILVHYYIIRHWLSSLALEVGLVCRDSCCCEWLLAVEEINPAWLCCWCWLYKLLRPLTWCALSWFLSTGSDCLLCWWSSITNWLSTSGALACRRSSLNTRSMFNASLAEHLTNELP